MLQRQVYLRTTTAISAAISGLVCTWFLPFPVACGGYLRGAHFTRKHRRFVTHGCEASALEDVVQGTAAARGSCPRERGRSDAGASWARRAARVPGDTLRWPAPVPPSTQRRAAASSTPPCAAGHSCDGAGWSARTASA